GATRAASATRRASAPESLGLSPKVALIGAVAVLTLALGATLATGHRGERLAAAIGTGVDNRFGEAGFRLRTIQVEGASPLAAPDIVKAAQIYRNQPLLGLDLVRLRKRVEGVGWVKEARV